MSELKQAINALEMCQELMLFDPRTGETHELWQENKDNQDLYNACTIAITALQEKLERENGCDCCRRAEGSIRVQWSTEDSQGMTTTNRSGKAIVCPMCGRKLKGSDQHE